MENLQIYNNLCKEEVLNGLQLQKKHSEYNIGKELFAVTDMGNIRSHQEDSCIIMEHPNYRGIKLLAVADGLGGYGDGDIVSNSVITTIANWFESERKIKQLNTIELKNRLEEVISLSIYGYRANPYAGTTLSLALIGNNKTMIANIGDSRIYTYKDGKLKQETKDDSEVEEAFENKIIPSRELMRFHKDSNILTQAILQRVPRFNTKFKLINSDYDSLIAVTDGVTDCLSTEELKDIIKNSKNTEIAKQIVIEALNNNSFLIDTIKNLSFEERQAVYEMKEIIKKDYFKSIPAGKDNTTAAVYVRKHE